MVVVVLVKYMEKLSKGMDTARAIAVSDFLPEAANALADDLKCESYVERRNNM